jgi:hypothetical protein
MILPRLATVSWSRIGHSSSRRLRSHMRRPAPFVTAATRRVPSPTSGAAYARAGPHFAAPMRLHSDTSGPRKSPKATSRRPARPGAASWTPWKMASTRGALARLSSTCAPSSRPIVDGAFQQSQSWMRAPQPTSIKLTDSQIAGRKEGNGHSDATPNNADRYRYWRAGRANGRSLGGRRNHPSQ